jgi:hypothetical protein
VHVCDHAGQDEKSAGDGEKPPGHASAIPKEQTHPEQQRHQRYSEGTGAIETSVRADHADLVGQKISSQASNDETDHKMP